MRENGAVSCTIVQDMGPKDAPRYNGLSFKVVMSTMRFSFKASRPPPPQPCRSLPAIKMGIDPTNNWDEYDSR